jgi:hypothetical protein
MQPGVASGPSPASMAPETELVIEAPDEFAETPVEPVASPLEVVLPDAGPLSRPPHAAIAKNMSARGDHRPRLGANATRPVSHRSGLKARAHRRSQEARSQNPRSPQSRPRSGSGRQRQDTRPAITTASSAESLLKTLGAEMGLGRGCRARGLRHPGIDHHETDWYRSTFGV